MTVQDRHERPERAGRATTTPAAPSTRAHDEVALGDALPELAIELSRTLIVAGAIASRDYQDVHHDPELARERGSEDVFMNILTTNGLVGRYLTDWAGPGAVLERLAIRLGAPNYPGDTMTLSGTVTDKGSAGERDDGRATVTVSVRGRNSRGDHVTGTARLALPLGRGRSQPGGGGRRSGPPAEVRL